MTETTYSELYKIINRAIKNYGITENVSLVSEIHIYEQKYLYRLQTNPQLNIFENNIPYKEQVEKTKLFCEDLDYFKQKTGLDSDDCDVSKFVCRRLLEQLDTYASHIEDENIEVVQKLKRTLKSYLPEYKKENTFAEYREEISQIKARMRYNKKYKNKNENDIILKQRVLSFFKKLLEDGYIKNMDACPEKIDLYEGAIGIVNTLPQNKYSRTKKFELKSNLYKEIAETAKKLGPRYILILEEANKNATRFAKAKENATKRRRMSPEESWWKEYQIAHYI